MSAQTRRLIAAAGILCAAIAACVASPWVFGVIDWGVFSTSDAACVDSTPTSPILLEGFGLEGGYRDLPGALFARIAGSDGLGEQVPYAFPLEVVNPKDLGAVHVASSKDIVGLVCPADDDIEKRVVELMQAKGWVLTSPDTSGGHKTPVVACMVKREGSYRWAQICLYRIGDSVTCVFHLAKEESEE